MEAEIEEAASSSTAGYVFGVVSALATTVQDTRSLRSALIIALFAQACQQAILGRIELADDGRWAVRAPR
jgi:uncharacterized membrane protein YjfL (UPF0719 family)